MSDETGALLLDDNFWSNLHVVNESGLDVDTGTVIEHLRRSPEVAALSEWASEISGWGGGGGSSFGRPGYRREGGILNRDRYVTPRGLFHQFRVAEHAAEHDDTVSGVLEGTESLAFSKMTMEAEDPDQGDVWNQIAGDLDLDSRMREMWRELFIYSQFVVAMYWGNKTYKVRGLSRKGVKRKKPFTVRVPLGMMMLDPYKVLPVGNFFFNQEKLVYIADQWEVDKIDAVLNGADVDPYISQMMSGRYEMDRFELKKLQDWGVLDFRGSANLFLLNPNVVFRHTETRPQYRPFANVRMKSVFELLDLKAQMRQRDRGHLLGATNFIVLIKKGSDALPATQKEVNALQGSARMLAQIPMLIGDHRLAVEIITPDQDYVLLPEKYNALDARITARLYQMFMTGNFAAGAKGDDSIKLARVVARGLESRRHQIKRSLERQVFKLIMENNPDSFTEMPDLRFRPKRIALDFDQNVANFMLELRQNGEISRDTLLSEFDFDQDEEARKRKNEEESGLDDIFKTQVPYSSPLRPPFAQSGPATKPSGPTGPNGNPQTPRAAGRSGGGIRNGGGAAPGTNQGKTKQQQADVEDDE